MNIRQSMFSWLLIVALVSLICPGLVVGQEDQGGELGMPAPQLSISQWIKGGPVDLAQGQGKIYVVEFWATWCPPCRTSIPHLTELQRKFKDQGVVIIGISTEEAEKVAVFVEKMGEKMDYTVAVDDQGFTTKAYMDPFGIDGIPHAFVVDKEGKLVWQGHPMTGLDEALVQLVAGTYSFAQEKQLQELNAMIQDYMQIITNQANQAQATEWAKEILERAERLKDYPRCAMILNDFAWYAMTDARFVIRDMKLALAIATIANDLLQQSDPAVLDTYALALFENGRLEEAYEWQKKAVSYCKDEKLLEELTGRLQRYETELKAKQDKGEPKEAPKDEQKQEEPK